MYSLLEKLGGEKRRWEVQIKEMSAELQALPLHALLVRYACYIGGQCRLRIDCCFACWYL